MRIAAPISALLLVLTFPACDKTPAASEARSEPKSEANKSGVPDSKDSGPEQAKPPTGNGPHFTKFPGEQTVAAEFIEQTLADHQDRRVMVYVGAEWCEPCQRFHDAVEAGELDDTFPDLELVEFDLDKHKPALTEAGYGSRLVPLFSVPNDEGKDQDLRMEGSIKGEAAVQDNLVPRLENLLARSKK